MFDMKAVLMHEVYPRKKCWQVDGKYLYFICVCISFVSVLVFVYMKGGLRHEVFVGKKRWQVHMLCINTFTLFLYSHALYDTFLHYIALQPEPSHQSTFPDLSAHKPPLQPMGQLWHHSATKIGLLIQ